MKILIVDDSMTSRLLFRLHLPESSNSQLYEAANVEDALTQAQAIQPDWVVLDYNMPDKNGIEIADAMREYGLRPNFVLLTAHTEQCVLDQASQSGFAQVLEKPITAGKISAMLGLQS